MRRRDDEHAIQAAFVATLPSVLAPGVLWWSTPNDGVRGRAEAGRAAARGLRPGAPDLWVYWGSAGAGTLVGLEFKAPGRDIYGRTAGKQSPAQQAFEREAVGAGAIYAVVREFREALEVLERAGCPLVRVMRGDRLERVG